MLVVHIFYFYYFSRIESRYVKYVTCNALKINTVKFDNDMIVLCAISSGVRIVRHRHRITTILERGRVPPCVRCHATSTPTSVHRLFTLPERFSHGEFMIVVVLLSYKSSSLHVVFRYV